MDFFNPANRTDALVFSLEVEQAWFSVQRLLVRTNATKGPRLGKAQEIEKL